VKSDMTLLVKKPSTETQFTYVIYGQESFNSFGQKAFDLKTFCQFYCQTFNFASL